MTQTTTSAALLDSPFMKACRREPTPYTPIWLMRQAGRYMKVYRDVRDKYSFKDLCKNADLAAEITLYAVERLGVDAAIIFSDILLILEPMGLRLEYEKGEGPVIHNPIRTIADIDALHPVTSIEPFPFLTKAIGITRHGLPSDIPLIGFCGAPFTLASYMIEGQGSRNYVRTKSLMLQEPQAWHTLMSRISDSLGIYLVGQLRLGAQAVQIFDSWVGCLSPGDFEISVLPYLQRIIQFVKREEPAAPIIYFSTDTAAMLPLVKQTGADVIGIDWRIALDNAWKNLGDDVGIMGNLDPTVLFAEPAIIKKKTQCILDQAGNRPGYIFNLGHGVLPETPLENVEALVRIVHEYTFQ